MMDFNRLVKENKKNIQNIIRLVTKEDNEDLEQEVYIRVLKNADKYEEKGSFKSWVTTIAKNISKDYLKSASYKARENSVSEEDEFVQIADKKITPELRVIKNERQQTIIDAVNSLKPKFREVVLMCEIYGYSYEDCAKKLNCPLGTVKSRLFNAKKELSILLADLI
ncbi:MAG: sigma-70 family RNA polymerase sigma factor [Fusobacterium sp.]|nr:sigma-70 family RNA polymerase sigma factor [Fusobacterium sp.]